MIIEILNCAHKPRAAIFMSGSGSNASRLMENLKHQADPIWDAACLVTDRPKASKAMAIGESYNVPVIDVDIRAFYRQHGLERISLVDEKARAVRKLWTEQVRRELSHYHIDFGIMAGFVPLSNITADFPCLNIHPGDLTVEEQGRRVLTGLHTVPVERAILMGFNALKSSVIIAQPYTGQGGEMDSGPILGISENVPIDYLGHQLTQLQAVHRERPEKRPKGGYQDSLSKVADHNLTRLKEQGDWVIFPQVVNDFAEGRFALDESRQLYFRSNDQWFPITTVVYGQGKPQPILAGDTPGR